MRLAKSGSVWQSFATNVIAHCAVIGITIPGVTTSLPLPAVPTALPFLFLTTSGRGSAFHRIYRPFDDLDVNTYTVASLLAPPFHGMRLPLLGARSAMPFLIIGAPALLPSMFLLLANSDV